MGPFELMDLVGVDVGLDVARSFYEQSFGEPRWRPSPIAVKTVAAGHFGRKSGRGYYDYSGGTDSYREPDPEPLPAGGGDGRRRDRRRDRRWRWSCARPRGAAGWDVLAPEEAGDRQPPFLILDVDRRRGRARGPARRAARRRSAAPPARWRRSTRAGAPSASTRCRRCRRRAWSS